MLGVLELRLEPSLQRLDVFRVGLGRLPELLLRLGSATGDQRLLAAATSALAFEGSRDGGGRLTVSSSGGAGSVRRGGGDRRGALLGRPEETGFMPDTRPDPALRGGCDAVAAGGGDGVVDGSWGIGSRYGTGVGVTSTGAATAGSEV